MLIDINRQVAIHRQALRKADELTEEQRHVIEFNRRTAMKRSEAIAAKKELVDGSLDDRICP